jgi:hypothetical protein
MQQKLDLIHHQEGSVVIPQRASDGYINATALCQAAGKKWSHYVSLASTKEFIAELSTDAGIPASGLIQSLSGGQVQGTWVHPQVAIHLAQWLSAKFAVMVSKWVYEWKFSGIQPVAPNSSLPQHLERYFANDGKVPPGYFSILQETALGLVGPLHKLGFTIPAGWVPDISVGKIFCAYLRDTYHVDTDSLPVYWHDYLDGRQLVSAKLYPEDLLVIYRTWFREVWLPINGVAYFKKKDKNSLTFLDKMPALAAPKTPVPKALPWHPATV